VYLAGFVVASWPSDATSFGQPTSVFGLHTGLHYSDTLAIDNSGNVYVADSQARKVFVFAPGAGVRDAPIRTLGGEKTGFDREETDSNGPDALAIDSDGRLYVADGDKIEVFAAGSGGDVAPIRVISGPATRFHGAVGLAVDSKGSVYVSDYSQYLSHNDVLIFSPGASGNVSPAHRISGYEGAGLAIDRSDRLYLCDPERHAIFVFENASKGAVTPIRSIRGPQSDDYGPRDIAIDDLGNIFVLDMVSGAMSVYAPDATGAARPIRVVQTYLVYRDLGSSASRKPSPMRLNPSTVIEMARPGNSSAHGADNQ
jgi:sugar lactone lactonase YvrE